MNFNSCLFANIKDLPHISLGFQFKHHVLFSHALNSCIRRQLLPADISQLLWAVIVRRYRLSATSVRILDIIEMSGQYDIAMVNNCDILAEFLHIAHLMAGENNDATFADQFPDDVL